LQKIFVRKSDKKIVSFGFDDPARFNLDHFDLEYTELEELPDERRFCKYENGEVVVDEVYKQQILDQQEAERIKEETAQDIFEDLLSVINYEELEQIAPKLSWIGQKTFQQVENYVENNTNNLSEARELLKVLAKIILANVKMIRLFADREKK